MFGRSKQTLAPELESLIKVTEQTEIWWHLATCATIRVRSRSLCSSIMVGGGGAVASAPRGRADGGETVNVKQGIVLPLGSTSTVARWHEIEKGLRAV